VQTTRKQILGGDNSSNKNTLFTINELNILETSKLMHKHNHLPAIFKNLFRVNNNIHNFLTHYKDNYHVPYLFESMSQQSIQVKSVKIWNALSFNIKTLQTKSAFSSKLKKHFHRLRQTSA